MKSAAEYIAEADGLISLCSTTEQARHAGANFGHRWAADVIEWERPYGQQPSERRYSIRAALAAELNSSSTSTRTHAFYDAAHSAFCLDAP